MDVFQSQVEALAFNYVSFEYLASLQSLLTCIAIFTAAISFWRIRTLGSNSLHRTKSSGDDSPSSLDRSCCFTPNTSSPPMQPVSTWSEKESEEQVEEVELYHQEQIACSSYIGVGDIEYDDKEDNGNGISIVEDKFAFYFQGEQSECDGDGDRWSVDVVCSYYRKELYCDGIKMMGRGRELGWYDSQDLTVFNGSVVRLWDCHRRRC